MNSRGSLPQHPASYSLEGKTDWLNAHHHPKAVSLHIWQKDWLNGGRQWLGSLKNRFGRKKWGKSWEKQRSWQLWRIRILLKGENPSENGKYSAEGDFHLASTGTVRDCRCIWRPKEHKDKGFVLDESVLAYTSPVYLNQLSLGLDRQLLWIQ